MWMPKEILGCGVKLSEIRGHVELQNGAACNGISRRRGRQRLKTTLSFNRSAVTSDLRQVR